MFISIYLFVYIILTRMSFLKYLMPYEEKWCKTMGYFNPYIDKFTTHLTDKMPFYDKTCYEIYPKYRHVYDKLWIIKSQGLHGGRLEKLKGKEEKVNYPIFIKPRWGHLSACSKNCYKINSADELLKYIDYKDMIWSEFIDATEGMTDYVLLNGVIVHQLTYPYSPKQNGFSDDWKYVSPDTTPPAIITDWVNQHMKGFTGIVNAQYRDTKIIEISLRLARGGAYLVSTQNAALITNINNIFLKKEWNHNLTTEMKFKPFYVYKCFTTVPILFLFPQKIVDWFVQKHTKYPFYEYYFEPTGATGMVFFQFMDDNFERGMATKRKIEQICNITQFLMFGLILLILVLYNTTEWKYRHVLSITVLLIWLSRFLNPFSVNYKIYKAYKQSIFGGGPSKETAEEIETFDNP